MKIKARSKVEFVNKFIENVGEKRTNVAFHEAARKTIEELGAMNGSAFYDITINDFENVQDVKAARSVKIATYANEGRILSAGMIRDFLLAAGVDAIKKNDEQNEGKICNRKGEELVSITIRLPNYCYNALASKAKKNGNYNSIEFEKAMIEYLK